MSAGNAVLRALVVICYAWLCRLDVFSPACSGLHIAPVNLSPRASWSSIVWWTPVVLMAAIGTIYASQLVLAGRAGSWGAALGIETVFWISWGVMSWLIFRLCRVLHRGGWNWQHVFVLAGGAVGAVVVFPVLFQALLSGAQLLLRAGSSSSVAPPEFWTAVRSSIVNLLGLTVVLYVATVLGWHALTHYRESRERAVKAAELESLLHQAQLEALRSQLHPHFLFNTLHAIAELVHENPALAEKLILRLADLLRSVLHTPVRQEVPLSEEIEFIKGYLEIEQMRLGETFSVVWAVATDTLRALVPGMLLHPLVENAVQHGIAALARPGCLSIRTRREGTNLRVQVHDTGPGVRETSERAPLDGGIGLSNTKARLQRLYGDGQHLEFVNEDGLTVNVKIPFVTDTAATAPAT